MKNLIKKIFDDLKKIRLIDGNKTAGFKIFDRTNKALWLHVFKNIQRTGSSKEAFKVRSDLVAVKWFVALRR